MSRSVLLLVITGLFAGGCLLTRSIIASHQLSMAKPPPAQQVCTAPSPVESPDTEPPPAVCPVVQMPPVTPAPAFVARSWGQEQACGPPDSPHGGDVSTAWAPATADNQIEWLELIYAEPVQPIAVLVFEACGPGALSQIELQHTSADAEATWERIWGDDPRPVGGNKRIVNVPVEMDIATDRVRLSLLSTMVPGWNEIDAVGLLDSAGIVHWAVAAIASTSYAGDSSEPLPPL